MGNRADRFAARLDKIGQDVVVYSYGSQATGDYVDSTFGVPDPDDADYPASGDPPSTIYGSSATEKAWVEPANGRETERVFYGPHGEQVQASWRAFLKATSIVGARSKITANSVDYWVAGLETWRYKGVLVYYLAWLTEMQT